MSTEYAEFLASKSRSVAPAGFEAGRLPKGMFPHQRAITKWATRMGRCAIFADTGLGKTLMLLAWADQVRRQTGRPVLVLTPLAVAEQTVTEAERFKIKAVVRANHGMAPTLAIYVTNYQKLHQFDPSLYGGVVLDESSILKAHDGKTRAALCEAFAATPYKLCCTATPAPNDHTEIGNHCEFLGVMSRVEMLATYFVHDSGDTSEWRLKGHAERDFWRWVAGWAILCRKPSDLGFANDGYDLPPLRIHEVEVPVEAQEGVLFAVGEKTLQGQRAARRETLDGRAATTAAIANESAEPCLVWCELNAEADACEDAIPDAVQVAGADSDEDKVERLAGFAAERHRVMVTKPSVAGFGLNWQHCSRMVFAGLSHSYEQFYQAVRRCWRFGQTKPVDVYVVGTARDAGVAANIARKRADHEAMVEGMLRHTRDVNREQLGATVKHSDEYRTGQVGSRSDAWLLHLGDCVEQVAKMDAECIDYSVFSPPFASLYTYSNSPRDMGNCGNYEQFWKHFSFLAPELFRVLKPGRLLSFHCFQLPLSKQSNGVIGLRDFRGDVIRLFESVGFVYHSEVCIWKDPVTAMQRTKALGLLHKQIKKDSCMSRQGIADYVVTMRKPGVNADPVDGRFEQFFGEDGPDPAVLLTAGQPGIGATAEQDRDRFSVEVWQRYASPVWTDIDQGDTLNNYRDARQDEDERHICPLQLGVIRRCLELWTNPGDLVLSPFAGIGSEGYVALQMRRRFVGVELKPSYFDIARINLKRAEDEAGQPTLFDCLTDMEEGTGESVHSQLSDEPTQPAAG